MAGKIIGIDLGTTNSCVAVLEGTEPVVIHNQEGGRTTPSMASWNQDGEHVVGAAAKRQAITNPQNTVFGIKRLIGRRYRSREVEHLRGTMPCEIIEAPNGDAWIQIRGNPISPQEVSALVLEKMKRVAEEYLGEEITEAIVTVPAYFDDVQRQATKDAGTISGLKVRAILNEPTAAALAFGLHHQRDQRVAVFDLGGGTFDISILTIENGVFEVLATSGDTFLGGDDFDRRIIDLLIKEFSKDHGLDLSGDAVALQRLKEASERAKIELSSSLTTDINLPFLAIGKAGPLHLQREIKRSEMELLCKDLLARLDSPCLQALSDAKLTSADIDQVVLVGGMTRMPVVQAKVEEIFGKKPSKGVNPDEIVAIGAAAQSAIMGGELQEVVLLDVTSHSMGIKVAGDRVSVIIPRNTTIPTRERKIFATTEEDQDFVAVEIVQGEGQVASENRMLGRFILGDLPKRPAGQVRVEVSFTMDADGILHVSATECSTGKATSITVQASSGLTAGELERIAGARAALRAS
ncbi:MAG: molecular chaperone DnaK [Deltaproteobacteria bacterium]|nr:molecular chaperone DnaK [Deltaproteobacteria bacterium]